MVIDRFLEKNFDTLGRVKAMQKTTITGREPLIAMDDSATYEQQPLMQELLDIVILVNLIVLVSIIMCA
ncbi:MAG: hypothetical protein FVQ84_07185 [Planctomycetes bacterium]|nr:hypothetical protein [Planctomycetota bacterium]